MEVKRFARGWVLSSNMNRTKFTCEGKRGCLKGKMSSDTSSTHDALLESTWFGFMSSPKVVTGDEARSPF